MKLHTVFITYNRLELTKRAIESYLETVTIPHSFTVVDNHSEDGTREWLQKEWDSRDFGDPFRSYSLLDQNRYPGFAANQGWSLGPSDTTHLHRADNDFIFLPGWCEEVERMFSENVLLGQLGLRTDEEELHNGHNVGGNCVIDRKLWDQGLRYLETPWPEIKVPGYTEDSFMSPDVMGMGYEWDRVERRCIQPISTEDPDDPYYIATWADRGITQ